MSYVLFAEDTSFSTVYDLSESANLLNNDLKKIMECAFKWKMLFNPDRTKQTQEVIFYCKNTKSNYPSVFRNEASVAHNPCQKHLGMHLDEKLNFNTHINEKIAKANKSVKIIYKLACVLPRESLVTICKSFVRPHYDYGDIIYDQPNNDSFCNMIERVQYNAALTITGVIKGTSQLKIYKELGFEFLKFRRLFRHLCLFYKSRSAQTRRYLFSIREILYITPIIRIKLKHIIVEQIYLNTPSFHIL